MPPFFPEVSLERSLSGIARAGALTPAPGNATPQRRSPSWRNVT
jgi:hypothetical protein